VAPIALLALLFNNQWVVDAIRDDLDHGSGIGPLVAAFQFPQWRLTAGQSNWSYVFALDFALLLFLVLLALLVFAGARAIDPRGGVLGALITGWWATAVAGGVAGVIGGALVAWALDMPGQIMSRSIWITIGNGASFGVLFGWIAGLGALAGFLVTRPRAAAQQPYGAQQQYGAQQPQPYAGQPYGGQPYAQPQPGAQVPQQGMPQQPVHPSAVPYVPPQGQPQQQPQWGAPAVPQQPGAPQQFGAPPAPPPQQAAGQQQPADQQQAAQPAPPAPEEPEASEAERADTDDRDKDAAEAEPGADVPKDDPEDDDLNLPDRTIVDRKRDDG
jgi:hypothetical protein